MGRNSHPSSVLSIVVAAAVTLIPAPLMAGAYGASAVKDATVSNQVASNATVYCARLKQDIPVSLQSQMDCGTGAPLAVKAKQSFFERFRHVPQSRTRELGGATRAPVAENDGPRTPPTATDRPAPTPVAEAPKPQSVNKWERLGQLGVTRDNFGQQDNDFFSDVKDHLATQGPEGDWSGFRAN